MPIEVQIKDAEEYNRLKKYAMYYSDRTQVLELPDNCSVLLSDNVNIDEPNSGIIVDYKNKKWIFENITDEIRYYLGDIYGGKPEYKFDTITQIVRLIEQRIVIPSNNVLDAFTKIKKTMKVSDLECYNKKYKVNGKWNTFEIIKDQELNYIFSDFSIKKKFINTREANIINSIESKDSKNRPYLDVSMQVVNKGYPETLNSKIYYIDRIMRINSPLMSILKVDNKINALIEEKPDKLLFSGVAPYGYKQNEELLVSPPKDIKKELGKLPVALYRIAYAEYKLREILK